QNKKISKNIQSESIESWFGQREREREREREKTMTKITVQKEKGIHFFFATTRTAKRKMRKKRRVDTRENTSFRFQWSRNSIVIEEIGENKKKIITSSREVLGWHPPTR